MKTTIKKILLIYISLVLIFAPSSIVYAASPAGWAFNKYDVATSIVTALKGGASASVAVAKSPIVSKVGKGILGGVIAGAALPLAISQISGIALDAVDWLLDSENNAIKYRKKGGDTISSIRVSGGSTAVVSTPEQACKAYFGKSATCSNINVVDNRVNACATWNGQTTPYCTIVGYYSDVPNNWQSVPIPTVADKVYDNAKTDSNSRSVVNDAVKDYVNEGSADVALDNAKADADATHGCGTGTHWSGSACVADTPSTPSTPTTPDTPFDPTSILDAIGKVFAAVMSLPDVINNALDDLLVDIKDFFDPVITKVTDFVDWVKQEPPQDEAPRNVPVGQLSDVELENFDRYQKRIYFAPHCPTTTFSLTVLGVTIVKPVDFTGFCAALEQVAPFLVASTYIACAVFVIREI